MYSCELIRLVISLVIRLVPSYKMEDPQIMTAMIKIVMEKMEIISRQVDCLSMRMESQSNGGLLGSPAPQAPSVLSEITQNINTDWTEVGCFKTREEALEFISPRACKTYVKVSTNGSKKGEYSPIYNCQVHLNCGHKLRLASKVEQGHYSWTVTSNCVQHSSKYDPGSGRGVPKPIREDLKAKFECDLSPQRVRGDLLTVYHRRKEDEKYAMLVKVDNRALQRFKSQVLKSPSDEIDFHHVIRTFHSRNPNLDDMDILYLNIFGEGIHIGDSAVISFSSRKLIEQGVRVLRERRQLALDATYKLFPGNFTLLTVGTTMLHYVKERRDIKVTFIPIIFSIAPSEKAVYWESTYLRLQKYFDQERIEIDLSSFIKSTISDKGTGLVSSLKYFQDNYYYLCYVHIQRTACCKAKNEKVVMKMLNLIYKIRNIVHIEHLWNIIKHEIPEESTFLMWFEEEYVLTKLVPKFALCCGRDGFGGNNNALESFNNSTKRAYFKTTGVMRGWKQFISTGGSRALRLIAVEKSKLEPCLPVDLPHNVDQAFEILSRQEKVENKVRKYHTFDNEVHFFLNAARYRLKEISEERIKAYLHPDLSLILTTEDFESVLERFHVVSVDLSQGHKCKCTCKTFKMTGTCHHLLIVRHVVSDIDYTLQRCQLPKERPGRKRSRNGTSLEKETLNCKPAFTEVAPLLNIFSLEDVFVGKGSSEPSQSYPILLKTPSDSGVEESRAASDDKVEIQDGKVARLIWHDEPLLIPQELTGMWTSASTNLFQKNEWLTSDEMDYFVDVFNHIVSDCNIVFVSPLLLSLYLKAKITRNSSKNWISENLTRYASKDLLAVVVNHNNLHWSLLLVDQRDCSSRYFLSVDSHNNCSAPIEVSLLNELLNLHSSVSKNVVFQPHIFDESGQDGHSCGVYVIFIMHIITSRLKKQSHDGSLQDLLLDVSKIPRREIQQYRYRLGIFQKEFRSIEISEGIEQ